ncbi:MAG: hypothetical protein PUJ62_01120 [Lachnospiraceae bacterium]|nr:hypothetical protein [Lachnospiraceae bacterium]
MTNTIYRIRFNNQKRVSDTAFSSGISDFGIVVCPSFGKHRDI